MTEEIVSLAINKKQQQQEQQIEATSQEIEPPAKKRRGVFDFIEECEKIQREAKEDDLSAQVELEIFLKEKVVGKVDVFEWWSKVEKHPRFCEKHLK